MTPANDYAYRQVMGSLPRRGAEVQVSEDGLTVTGTFPYPDAAECAWAALGTKYPKHNVTVTQDGNVITFQFAPARRVQEGTMMRLTTKQLRKIIRENVAARLAALDEASELETADMTDSADFISGALANWLDEEGHDLIASNAWEMMMGTVGEENLSVPGRVEDVDHFAEQIAAKVVSDPVLKEAITKIAKTILETSMQEFGSGGPGSTE